MFQQSNTIEKKLTTFQLSILVILRIAIGWHLLFEGAAKLLTPGWTSAGYLSMSRWILSDFFNWIVSAPTVLRVVDILNIWGLIFIGLGLMLGCFTRIASISEIFLLLLYYVANPPFIGMDFGVPAEGHYLFVNKNLVELFALCLLAVFPTGTFLGLDRFILAFRQRKTKADGEDKKAIEQVTKEERTSVLSLNRREIIKNLATVPLLGAFIYGAYKKNRWEKINAITGATIKLNDLSLKDLKGELPQGQIGNLKMSRVIIGNNLIGGWAHSRDLIYAPSLFRAYNTERKVLETLDLAEKAGINTMMLVNHQYPLFNKYCNVLGGKMQTICQVFPKQEDMTTDIDTAIDNGATTLYIQGAVCDRFVNKGRVDLIAEALEYIKKQGYVAGIGAHSIQVIIQCEKAGLEPDYYVKTMHHDQYWSAIPKENRKEFSVDNVRFDDHNKFHDNMFDLFPEETIAFIKKVDKPLIAFKVLAAGAIHPKSGFKYAFENGADFICVGMFDFQIVEDVNIAVDVLTNITERERPWMA